MNNYQDEIKDEEWGRDADLDMPSGPHGDEPDDTRQRLDNMARAMNLNRATEAEMKVRIFSEPIECFDFFEPEEKDMSVWFIGNV